MATKLETKPTGAGDLYSQDFAAWTSEQAALLRALRFAELDVVRLAEEIENLGHSERDAVRSQARHPRAPAKVGAFTGERTARRLERHADRCARTLEDKLSPSLRTDLETA